MGTGADFVAPVRRRRLPRLARRVRNWIPMRRTHALLALLLAALPLIGPLSTTAAAPAGRAGVPELVRWQRQMVIFGRKSCEYLRQPHTNDELLTAVYYDAIDVFLQIADYTRDPAWTACVQRAKTIYRDQYVLANQGKVPGYWNFTNGLTRDYLKTGDPASKEAVITLSQNAAYTPDLTPLDWTASAWRSREVAYAIMSYINAEKLGAPPRARLARHVDQALSHIDQWFISKSFRCPRDCDPAAAKFQYYIQPFMVGLTAEALIMHFDKTHDPRIVPAIQAALDWLWAHAWVPADESFWYENWVSDPGQPFPPRPGSPDLNLLIAPAYAWLYRQTGDVTYRQRGDQVFAGGVKRAFLAGNKQFNQSYWTSFDFVRWRAAGSDLPAASPGTRGPAPATAPAAPHR